MSGKVILFITSLEKVNYLINSDSKLGSFIGGVSKHKKKAFMGFIVFSQKRFIAVLNYFKSYQLVLVGIGTGIHLEHRQYITKEDNLLFSTHTIFIDLLKLWSSVGLLMSSKGCPHGYNMELLRCWNFQVGDTQWKQLDHYEPYPQNKLIQSRRTTISFHNSNLSLKEYLFHVL